MGQVIQGDCLEVMPNLMASVSTSQTHVVSLDPACPASGNPKKGSSIEISYAPQNWHLEVYSLRAFIENFKGGLKYPEMLPGEYAVRDQEHMIQYVAQACADALGVKVTAAASLILSDGVSTSRMYLKCVATAQTKQNPTISRFANVVF